jgi:hypothetical protein
MNDVDETLRALYKRRQSILARGGRINSRCLALAMPSAANGIPAPAASMLPPGKVVRSRKALVPRSGPCLPDPGPSGGWWVHRPV